MSKQVFIINDPSTLKVSIGGAALGATTTVGATSKEVAFSVTGATNTVGLSSDFDNGECVFLEDFSYYAGRSQVATANLSGATGDIYVKVINTSIGTANLPMKTFSGTAAQIAAAITAAGGDFAAFTATVSTNTVQVTAAVNSSFRLAASEGAELIYTVTGKPSSGTSDDVLALEEMGLPYWGVTNKVGFPVVKPTSKVVAGNQYTIVVADFVTVANSKDGGNALKGEDVKLIFAIKESGNSTAISNLTTALGHLL